MALDSPYDIFPTEVCSYFLSKFIKISKTPLGFRNMVIQFLNQY